MPAFHRVRTALTANEKTALIGNYPHINNRVNTKQIMRVIMLIYIQYKTYEHKNAQLSYQ